MSGREGTLFTYDNVKIKSGEILTVCGNYDGPYCRTRLSFYPQTNGERMIDNATYTKVTYETGYSIEQLPKLLDLPGEQHYLLNRSNVVEIYRASDTFRKLSPEDSIFCETLIDKLNGSCQISRDAHGLTGSLALHGRIPSSDFDWVTYIHDPINVEFYIKSDTNFQRELTFSTNHVRRKYSVFNHFNDTDIDNLFADRWKYFRYKHHLVSISFVDPKMRADNLLLAPMDFGDRIDIRGRVSDVVGSYHMPYMIPIEEGDKNHMALTWLFLYNGAFRRGDIVEVAGRKCQTGGQEYVLIDTPDDYIRKVDKRKT